MNTDRGKKPRTAEGAEDAEARLEGMLSHSAYE
jgi:hypothetical protein